VTSESDLESVAICTLSAKQVLKVTREGGRFGRRTKKSEVERHQSVRDSRAGREPIQLNMRSRRLRECWVWKVRTRCLRVEWEERKRERVRARGK